ncbi:MAG: TonB-dependent receptor [Candidatus Solibacter usitatus]|nr:TonB-dependent receptor [Candidatus Solibacter usitatus]
MFPSKLISLTALFVLMVFAQSERGTITGIVSDPTGAAIAGAELLVVNRDTNATLRVSTTASGEYSAPNLLPGVYRIEVSASGFKRLIEQNLIVAASSTVRVDSKLQLGQVSEQVEVTAQAAVIQTENARVTSQVQNKLVDELPLVVGGAMRSPFNLVAVAAEAKGSGQRLSLGGGQVAQWDATLDGYSVGTNRSGDTDEAALNTPSVESLTEFAVDTNGFKAEYGQAGGGVLTFASKSGTNALHGSVYDFLRNDKMDARGFFAPTRSIYRQNDYGFSASGPVLIPKLYNGRNKTFFFVSYEGFRNRVGANATILTVPSQEMYSGDFRNWVDGANRSVAIYDPSTTRPNAAGNGFVRDVFAGNQVPANRFSPTAAAIAKYGQAVRPNRGFAAGTSNYVRQNYIVTGGTEVTPTDKWSIKGDQQLTDKQRVSILWNMTQFRRQPGAGGPPGLPEPIWNNAIQAWDTDAIRLSHDWTISSTMVNHFSYARNTFTKNSFSGNVDKNWKDKICIKNVVDCNQNFPTINFSEYTSWGSASYNGTDQPGWGIKNDLSAIRGSHTLKFGFQHQNQNANGFGQQDIAGRADFNFLSTSIPGSTSFPNSGGSAFASFLLGEAYLGRTETIRYVTQKFSYFGFYAQDDWRINRKLVLNVGLRYDVTLPPTNLKDEYSDFNPTTPNPGANGYPGALWFAGFGSGRENSRSLVPGWYGAFGPRIGLAYSANNKTTVRTAFARSFSRVTAVQGSGHFAGFIGQYQFDNASQGVQPTFKLDQGLPAYKLPPSIDPAFSNGNTVDFWNGRDATRAPENLSWTFTIQRQVTGNTVVEAGYNATVGTHMQSGILNLNQVPTATFDRMVAQFGVTQALAILRSDITSATARTAGINAPYPSFVNQSLRTVNQALRPFPQYSTISTGPQNGDKSGHSSYHSFMLKADRRFSKGMTFQWSYVLSKLMTDSDTYFANSATGAMDQYNRRLEKSIGQFDQTHVIKFSTLYDLPFGKGQRWLNSGLLSHVAGGWRLSGIQVYSSGVPLALSRNNPLPIFNSITRPLITSYDDWRAPIAGSKFDPNVDRFLKPASFFPVQPNGFGNETRYNPKLRSFWGKSENLSVAKSFRIRESLRIDLRGEAFNLFNRTIFGTGSLNLNAANIGQVTNQANEPRQMQVALKFYW